MNIFQRIFSDHRLPFILLTLAAIVWLVCLPLFQDGMFMDGTQYAAVARNMAKGIGTFWFPVFSENFVAGLNSFHEHPPLVYYLQSFFFKAFGVHNIYPERIYGLTLLLLTAFFMVLIWKNIFKTETDWAKQYWLPVLLWLFMPVVFWSFTNNIHEITLGFFTTAAIYFLLKSLEKISIYKSISFYAAIACIVAAFLSKGVPALFPLAFFGIHFLVFRKITFVKAAVYTIYAMVILGIITLLILAIPDAKSSLHIWFYDRMLHRISNNPVSGSHFHILKGLLSEQLPPMIIAAVLWAIFYFSKTKNTFFNKPFTFFFLVGLSASLPLMLTLVQRNFYFVPALPFFAMAWAASIIEGVSYFMKRIKPHSKAFGIATITIFFILLGGIITTVLKAGTIKRHKAQLEDVYSLQKLIAAETTVCVPAEIMWHDWSFRCYMMSYNDISFAKADTCQYFISAKKETELPNCTLKESFQQYHLFEMMK